VLAYKFLDADGRAPFTGVRWPLDEWVEASDAVPCRDGVHACRAGDVAYWLAATLWHVELDGSVVETTHKVAASRGRLVAPVDGYESAMHELRSLAAWRSRDRAVSVLRGGDTDERVLGDALAAAADLAQLAGLGARCDESTFGGRAGALAADAAHFALHGAHAQAPFVAACSAGHVAAGPSAEQTAFDRGYRAEREHQSEFLIRRLGL
jgi:hypothetical protein